jgi:hypothetical protein
MFFSCIFAYGAYAFMGWCIKVVICACGSLHTEYGTLCTAFRPLCAAYGYLHAVVLLWVAYTFCRLNGSTFVSSHAAKVFNHPCSHQPSVQGLVVNNTHRVLTPPPPPL